MFGKILSPPQLNHHHQQRQHAGTFSTAVQRTKHAFS